MITSIILKEERKKNCKKKLFLIFKIPIIYFLPITKNNNSSKISTYANFGHLMQSDEAHHPKPNLINLLFCPKMNISHTIPTYSSFFVFLSVIETRWTYFSELVKT